MRALSHDTAVIGRFHELTAAAGITPSAGKALLQLFPDRRLPMRELAAALRCDGSYVTAVVDALEAAGVAERQPHPTDRRVKVITLTDAGRGLADRLKAVIDEPPAVFATLGEDEARQLRELLRKLTASNPQIEALVPTGEWVGP